MSDEIRVCPQCGSTDLSWPKLAEHNIAGPHTGMFINVFRCESCGYEGVCPVINMDNLEAFQKECARKGA